MATPVGSDAKNSHDVDSAENHSSMKNKAIQSITGLDDNPQRVTADPSVPTGFELTYQDRQTPSTVVFDSLDSFGSWSTSAVGLSGRTNAAMRTSSPARSFLSRGRPDERTWTVDMSTQTMDLDHPDATYDLLRAKVYRLEEARDALETSNEEQYIELQKCEAAREKLRLAQASVSRTQLTAGVLQQHLDTARVEKQDLERARDSLLSKHTELQHAHAELQARLTEALQQMQALQKAHTIALGESSAAKSELQRQYEQQTQTLREKTARCQAYEVEFANAADFGEALLILHNQASLDLVSRSQDLLYPKPISTGPARSSGKTQSKNSATSRVSDGQVRPREQLADLLDSSRSTQYSRSGSLMSFSRQVGPDHTPYRSNAGSSNRSVQSDSAGDVGQNSHGGAGPSSEVAHGDSSAKRSHSVLQQVDDVVHRLLPHASNSVETRRSSPHGVAQDAPSTDGLDSHGMNSGTGPGLTAAQTAAVDRQNMSGSKPSSSSSRIANNAACPSLKDPPQDVPRGRSRRPQTGLNGTNSAMSYVRSISESSVTSSPRSQSTRSSSHASQASQRSGVTTPQTQPRQAEGPAPLHNKLQDDSTEDVPYSDADIDNIDKTMEQEPDLAQIHSLGSSLPSANIINYIESESESSGSDAGMIDGVAEGPSVAASMSAASSSAKSLPRFSVLNTAKTGNTNSLLSAQVTSAIRDWQRASATRRASMLLPPQRSEPLQDTGTDQLQDISPEGRPKSNPIIAPLWHSEADEPRETILQQSEGHDLHSASIIASVKSPADGENQSQSGRSIQHPTTGVTTNPQGEQGTRPASFERVRANVGTRRPSYDPYPSTLPRKPWVSLLVVEDYDAEVHVLNSAVLQAAIQSDGRVVASSGPEVEAQVSSIDGNFLVLETIRLSQNAQNELNEWSDKFLFSSDDQVLTSGPTAPADNLSSDNTTFSSAQSQRVSSTSTHYYDARSTASATSSGSNLPTWQSMLLWVAISIQLAAHDFHCQSEAAVKALYMYSKAAVLALYQNSALPQIQQTITWFMSLLLTTQPQELFYILLTIAGVLFDQTLIALQHLHKTTSWQQYLRIITTLYVLLAVWEVSRARRTWRDANTSTMRETIMGWREDAWEWEWLTYARWYVQVAVERKAGRGEYLIPT